MARPLVAVIGGSGVGQAVETNGNGQRHDVDTPFGKPSGPVLRTRWEGAEILFLARHGPGHVLPPGAVPYRANIWALKSLGATHIIASGATGSLREEIRPRDLVVPDQLIDKTHRRTGSFFDEAGVAVHVEFSEPFCPVLRERLLSCSHAVTTTVHDGGTYVCMEGPAFSTVAESRMHRAWGGDLIGMTCLPEAKLAREAELCYALLALPTDYDCWRPHDPGKDRQALLEEIMGNFHAVTASSIELLKATLRTTIATPLPDCTCQHALERAIWSDRAAIPLETRKRLDLLLARRM